MRLVSATELVELGVAVLVEVGTPWEEAFAVVGSLVRSNLLGHDSHGVRRLVPYVADVRQGRIDPRARPEAERTRPGTVVVHGRRAFGQLSAGRAVRELRDMAGGGHGMGGGVAVVRDCNHVGRLGEYVAELAERDLVAMAFGNADPTVAPYGGRERRLGTNPLAWAVPRARGKAPVVMDWATSGVAEGKLAVARDRHERVAEGLVLDVHGRMSTDPNDFYAGGVLLPFGGHKGYGLSVLIELVGGLLTGAGVGSMPGYDGDFGTVFVAFAIDAFQPADEFRGRTEEFCERLAATPLAHGHREVLVPGEPEERTRAEREREGIPVTETTWRELEDLLRE
jgi:LDH2 family malate/lactate/ureidoglycolate dehydrogenase